LLLGASVEGALLLGGASGKAVLWLGGVSYGGSDP
jgi:hypothetical protein